jgi:transcription antitermination protein NusB
MSFEKAVKSSGTRHKAREAALQMLFAADLYKHDPVQLTEEYWNEFGDTAVDTKTREFADTLVRGTLRELSRIDERIKIRAEHWRIERMAIVDRNVLRLAVYEFLFEDTPDTVVINEALEIARRFSTFEATQFINGILDAVKHDVEAARSADAPEPPAEKSQASSL